VPELLGLLAPRLVLALERLLVAALLEHLWEHLLVAAPWEHLWEPMSVLLCLLLVLELALRLFQVWVLELWHQVPQRPVLVLEWLLGLALVLGHPSLLRLLELGWVQEWVQ
jgi:hypothetical protein